MDWILATSWMGFATAVFHVLSGPDHLAAVSTLAIQNHKKSWLTGMAWGGGHATGVCLLGLLLLLVRETVPVETVSQYSERIVGIVLIAMGAWGIQKSLRTRIHTHQHTHDHTTHVHIHTHAHPHGAQADLPHTHTHASWWVGVLHGLAGGSHILGVMPTLAMPSRIAAATYLAAFSIGTMIAMIIFSAGIGWMTLRLTRRRLPLQSLMMTSGMICIVMGIFWLWS